MNPKARFPRCSEPVRSGGFTLIELLVVLAIVVVAMLLGIPALHNLIIRSRTEGYAREASVLMQRTRLEAIKMSRDGVVYLDPANRRLVGFIDADRSGTFNPDPDEPPRTTDYVLGRLPLSENVEFEDQAGNTGATSVVGKTEVEVGGDPLPAVIFRANGSIVDPRSDDGDFAFRVSDVRGNHLEVRVFPQATGRIELRKWQTVVADGVAKDDWYGSGDPGDEGFVPWKWN